MDGRYECSGGDHQISRRRMMGLLAGGAAAGGLGLGSLLQPAAARSMQANQKQVLFIFLDGGLSQFESWDPKPGSDFGGPFRSIPTSIPGVHLSELMPLTARRMDKLSLIRSMSTKFDGHDVDRAQRGDPLNRGANYPLLGSAVARLLGPLGNGLPAYISVKPGGGGFLWKDAGFLGAKYGALALGDGKPPGNISRPDAITKERDQARQELRKQMNDRFRRGRVEAEVDAYETTYDMAMQLMEKKELFDPSRIPARDVERYGKHPLGRHLLQARVLLEAGVRFVKVTSYHWDTHGDNFQMHRSMVPQVDQPFSAVLDDLGDRGLLDHVLVVMMSEFGRTPKINPRWGRDHWPGCWSVALAGCGLKRGIVIGNTDKDGLQPVGKPYDFGDLFHTIFAALGIDAGQEGYPHNGQNLAIAHSDCAPIQEILA